MIFVGYIPARPELIESAAIAIRRPAQRDFSPSFLSSTLATIPAMAISLNGLAISATSAPLYIPPSSRGSGAHSGHLSNVHRCIPLQGLTPPARGYTSLHLNLRYSSRGGGGGGGGHAFPYSSWGEPAENMPIYH